MFTGSWSPLTSSRILYCGRLCTHFQWQMLARCGAGCNFLLRLHGSLLLLCDRCHWAEQVGLELVDLYSGVFWIVLFGKRNTFIFLISQFGFALMSLSLVFVPSRLFDLSILDDIKPFLSILIWGLNAGCLYLILVDSVGSEVPEN